MRPMIATMPGAAGIAAQLLQHLDGDLCDIRFHRFPDGETCPRLTQTVDGRDLVLVCALDRPDGKLIDLYLAANIARELGARSVGLVIPYLPYMRQDARFRVGEGITSVHIAGLLSSCCDWLVTVDPHLHRHRALSDLYSVPTRVVHAAPWIAAWIAANVRDPVVIGPDAESEQWAGEVAQAAGCPYTVLRKRRGGDRRVQVSAPDTSGWQGRTPVLVDDIVSTARTMMSAAAQLAAAGQAVPVCIAVHPLFADDAYSALQAGGIERIVSCNTVEHASNGIDVSAALAVAVADLLEQGRAQSPDLH